MSSPKDRAIVYCGYSQFELQKMTQKLGFKGSMALMREMQECLAKSAQKGPQGERLPIFAQKDLLQRIAWVTKWCRLTYLYYRMKELRREYPEATHRGRKIIANGEWEAKILPQWRY